MSAVDAEELWRFDLQGHLILKGVMDSEWIAEAEAAIDAFEHDASLVEHLTNEGWISQAEALQRAESGTLSAGYGEEVPLKLRGENIPLRRLTRLYELPDPFNAPFRRMIAHPAIVHRLNWMLGAGFRESVPPEAQCWRLGAAGIGMHGSGVGAGAFRTVNGGAVCNQVNVTWQLRDVTEHDGGFAAIPVSPYRTDDTGIS